MTPLSALIVFHQRDYILLRYQAHPLGFPVKGGLYVFERNHSGVLYDNPAVYFHENNPIPGGEPQPFPYGNRDRNRTLRREP